MATKCYLKHFWASDLYNLYLFNHGIASPVKYLNPINHSHTKGLSNALCTDLGGYAGCYEVHGKGPTCATHGAATSFDNHGGTMANGRL